MSKLRTGLILAASAAGVVSIGAAATLHAQKNAGAVVVARPGFVSAGPLTIVANGPDQIATVFTGGGPRIGVQIRDVAADETSKLGVPVTAGGVVVESVSPGTPAESAGVKAGDVIAEFDGERIRSAAQLTRLVRESVEGRAVKVGVWRDGKRTELTITPAAGESGAWTLSGDETGKLTEKLERHLDDFKPKLERELPRLQREFRLDRLPEGRSFRFAPRDEGGRAFSFLFGSGRGRLGIGVEDLTEQLATYFGTKGGVLVRSVDDESPAAKAGIKAGDVVTSVNGETVKGVDELLSRLDKLDDGAEISIGVVRDRKPQTLKATLEARGPERRRSGRGLSPII